MVRGEVIEDGIKNHDLQVYWIFGGLKGNREHNFRSSVNILCSFSYSYHRHIYF